MSRSLVVKLTAGAEEPERANQAFTVAAAALAFAGTLGTGAALGVQHVAMVPAMLGVMLWRYEEYAHPHARGV